MDDKNYKFLTIGFTIGCIFATSIWLYYGLTPTGSNDPNGENEINLTLEYDGTNCDAVYLSYPTPKDAKLAQMKGLVDCKPSDNIQELMDSTMQTQTDVRKGSNIVIGLP